MKVNWDEYAGANRQRWAELLRELIGHARRAIESNDDTQRQAVWDSLDSYIERSPNTFSRRFDEMARATLDDIFKSATEDLIQRIASRTSELTTYLKEVRVITEEANADARSLSLELPRNAIESTTKAIDSLKTLLDSIRKGGEDATNLATDIDKAIKAIQKVRTSIEDAPRPPGSDTVPS